MERGELSPEEVTREYYNTFTPIYEAVWSDQIHTGFFDREKPLDQAVADMDEYLANLAELPDGANVLTVGCGSGGPDRFLVKHKHAHVTGLDLSEEQLARAAQRATAEGLSEIQYVQGSMSAIPLESQLMDCVWAQESFFYCPDKLKAISEFARVLKPDGRVVLEDTILADPKAKMEVMKAFGYRVGIPDIATPDQYVTWFKSAGFKLRQQADMSENLAQTYTTIIQYIKDNEAQLAAKFPDYKWSQQLGHPDSLRLVQEGKLGCVALVFEKS